MLLILGVLAWPTQGAAAPPASERGAPTMPYFPSKPTGPIGVSAGGSARRAPCARARSTMRLMSAMTNGLLM